MSAPEPGAKTLDFLVIGAPKSATTTLHELLKEHPQIALPVTKEAPFFTHDEAFARGFPAYLAGHFADADPTAHWGTVTPHYMQGQGEVDVALGVRRIHDEVPSVKIIALLRDPVERTFSHYKMQLQRGYESRSFGEVIEQALTNAALDPRGAVNPEDPYQYVYVGEYGRILQHYYALFPRENILVLTTDELRDDPAGTVRGIYAFLGVDTGHQPAGIHQRYRQGGSRPRLRILTPGALYRIPFLKRVWKSAVPLKLRNRIEYRTNLWNMKPDDITLQQDSEAYGRLVEFFSDDVRRLEEITGRTMPWAQWRGSEQRCGPALPP